MAFRFEKLEIWGEANNYADAIYEITKKFPKQEIFGLTDQLRRAANSIAVNIAEGSGSSSSKDFINYLNIAIKSTYETVSHLQRAINQGYISEEKRSESYNQAEILVKKIQKFKSWLKKRL